MGKDIELSKQTAKMPPLSIFIPTYGRDTSLKEAIYSIMKYWNKDDIDKVIVSDNNENNLAFEIIEAVKFEKIYYNKNETNIGIDRNLLRFLELCNSNYCWLLGDDDKLNESSYQLIQPFLNEDLDFILLLNADDKNYQTGVYTINDKHFYKKMFIDLWYKITFGHLIVNVNIANKLKNDDRDVFNKYIGTSHAYCIIWEMIVSKYSSGKFGIICENAVGKTKVEKSWSGNFLEVYLVHPRKWYKTMPLQYEEAIAIVYKKYLAEMESIPLLISFAKYIHINENKKEIFFNYIKDFPISFKIKIKVVLFLLPFLLYVKKSFNINSNNKFVIGVYRFFFKKTT